MLLLVSGEGPTDLGSMQPLVQGMGFQAGPMTVLMDCLLESRLGYSMLAFESIQFVPKPELVHGSHKHAGRQFSAPGKRQPKESIFYFENARRLAMMAEEKSQELNRPVIPVLFRDADGTQSSGRGEWRAKWKSMEDGFVAGGSGVGVPMLPQPKSEAWLLCACREPIYQHCERLEHESGNDAAPNALKLQLDEARAGASSGAELVEAIMSGVIDPLGIDMPSFNEFKSRLLEVVDQLHSGN